MKIPSTKAIRILVRAATKVKIKLFRTLKINQTPAAVEVEFIQEKWLDLNNTRKLYGIKYLKLANSHSPFLISVTALKLRNFITTVTMKTSLATSRGGRMG